MITLFSEKRIKCFLVAMQPIAIAGEHNGRGGDCVGRPLLPPRCPSAPARPGKGQPTLRQNNPELRRLETNLMNNA